MGIMSSIGQFFGGAASGAAAPIAGVIELGKGLADKLWMGKAEGAKLDLDRAGMQSALTLGILELKQAGQISEYADEADRRKDIRESGWLSRQVRPVIALTFHGAFWAAYFFDPGFKEKMGTVIAELMGSKITVGAMYVLIVCFYFLTKGVKDYYMSKNPSAGVIDCQK